MRRRRIRPALLLPGLLLLLAAVSLPLLALLLTDSGKARELAAVAQASVTAFAILAGGLFAAYKLEVFRDFEPHLTITHDISHRPVSDSYIHISVSVTLHNSSRVKVDIVDGIFRLYHVAPLSDEQVEQLYLEMPESGSILELEWPVISESQLARGEGETYVEPGEFHQETIDFIVSSDTKSVVVYTFLGDSRYSITLQGQRGWDLSSVYDIVNIS